MTNNNKSANEDSVLIVGGGPSGCTQALLLAQFGIKTVIVERLTSRSLAPKAHAMNPRSLEICQAMGFSYDQLKAIASPREDGGSVFFLPRLDAPILGKLPYEKQGDDTFEITPTPLVNIPQPDFEKLLLAEVEKCPLIELRRGHTWTGATEQSNGVVSQIDDQQHTYSIQSAFVVAADGAASLVRNDLGIGMEGEANVMACVSITFSANLREALDGRLGLIYWLTDPACKGVLLCYRVEDLWSLILLMPFSELDMSLYTEEHCADLVRNAVGYDMDDFELKVVAPWTMNSEIAESYQKGRFFLIGDAAHRFPPSGGLGLNTGILEANNLAWKIAAVLQGWATGELLASYERESQPIATQNAVQSLANARRLEALAELSCPAEIWTSTEAFDAWMNQGDRRSRINEAVELQRQHFNSIGLQLGFSYDEKTFEGDVEVFVPRADVGFRMPHAWLTKGQETLSTLDLLDLTTFTLITGKNGGNWTSLCDQMDAPIQSISLDEQFEGAREWLALVEVPETGALIVRPDGHILAKVKDDSEQSFREVKLAFTSLLGSTSRINKTTNDCQETTPLKKAMSQG